MHTLDRRMSFEFDFNRVAIAVADMLSRQMDDVFVGLVLEPGTQPDDPIYRTAEAANRIIVLCRRLSDELQRYECCDRSRREAEDEADVPF